MTTFEFEREHYRVVYPAGTSPTFVGNGMEREVIDLCEAGPKGPAFFFAN